MAVQGVEQRKAEEAERFTGRKVEGDDKSITLKLDPMEEAVDVVIVLNDAVTQTPAPAVQPESKAVVSPEEKK